MIPGAFTSSTLVCYHVLKGRCGSCKDAGHFLLALPQVERAKKGPLVKPRTKWRTGVYRGRALQEQDCLSESEPPIIIL
jgi:hypothetical protein